MAQFKKAIFTGRLYRKEYEGLAVRNNLKMVIASDDPDLAKHFSRYDFAFVNGYLSILEALVAKVPVFSYYANPVKKDYLYMTPFAKYITIFNDFSTVSLKIDHKKVLEGQKWAKKQNWEKLVDVYEELWSQ